MVFKKKEKVEEEFVDDEFTEEYEEEEVPLPPQRKSPTINNPPKVEEYREQRIEIDIREVLLSHEQRIKDIEAALFRLRHI